MDEAGDLGALGNPPRPNDQPVLAIGGLFVDAANLPSLTDNFLTLKHHYFPGLPYPSAKHLDRILPEVKGADIRVVYQFDCFGFGPGFFGFGAAASIRLTIHSQSRTVLSMPASMAGVTRSDLCTRQKL